MKYSKVTPKTIYDYLNYLEEGYLLLGVSKEDLVAYNEVTWPQKYYLIDQGFYKSELEEKQINIGRRIEKYGIHTTYLEMIIK